MTRLVEVETNKPYVSLCLIFWIPLHGDHGTPCQVILLRSSIWALLVHLYPGAPFKQRITRDRCERSFAVNQSSILLVAIATFQKTWRTRPGRGRSRLTLLAAWRRVRWVCWYVGVANPMIWLTSGPPLKWGGCMMYATSYRLEGTREYL